MSKVTGEDRETEILNCIQEAISRASECDDIIIVMQYKPDSRRDGATHYWAAPDSSTAGQANWLLDTCKTYLLSGVRSEDE